MFFLSLTVFTIFPVLTWTKKCPEGSLAEGPLQNPSCCYDRKPVSVPNPEGLRLVEYILQSTSQPRVHQSPLTPQPGFNSQHFLKVTL